MTPLTQMASETTEPDARTRCGDGAERPERGGLGGASPAGLDRACDHARDVSVRVVASGARTVEVPGSTAPKQNRG